MPSCAAMSAAPLTVATTRMRRPVCGYAAPTLAVATAKACQRRAGETDLRERRGTSSSDEVEESDDGEPVRREVSISLPRSPPATADEDDRAAAGREGGEAGDGGDISADQGTRIT